MTTKTEFTNFEDEFFRRIREKEAWKLISENAELPWDINLIEKYADKLDWEALCANNGINWDMELIEKFKHHIDWDALSGNILGGRYYYKSTELDWSIFSKFENYWNWHLLSMSNTYLPVSVIEQHADKWDWKELINNNEIQWSYNLFNKFKNYIPTMDFETLKRSELWEDLIKIDERIITGKILANM